MLNMENMVETNATEFLEADQESLLLHGRFGVR